MPLCRTPIELGHSVVVYCVLKEKHQGRCLPEKVPCQKCVALARWWKEHGGAPVVASEPNMCVEISPHDKQPCGFPAGHNYQHGSGVLRRTWE